ncbi:hypothetical protein [Rhodococcus sp. YH1]|uniref:hypothetical protein n=1 Tax=Rhodococcus sp. YH1 TaxID=89066 RepID=UPI00138727AE|nr:hypothetical protein [Rhodococcus sp. YH1]
MSAEPLVHGLLTAPADTGLVDEIVVAVTATAATISSVGAEVEYLIAEYEHGYDTARQLDGIWRWASAVSEFAGRPGHPTPGPRHGLDRVRLFGADSELVVWRTAHGFAGCWSRTDPEETTHPWLEPRSRTYLLCDIPGARRDRAAGFTRIRQLSGQFTVHPFEFSDRGTPLGHTREFFSTDPGTGAVFVAAVTWTGYSDVPTPADSRKGTRR